MKHRWRIWLLVVSHVLAGLALVRLDRDPFAVFPMDLAATLALLFAQSSLLGCWLALGAVAWWIRLVCAPLGVLWMTGIYVTARGSFILAEEIVLNALLFAISTTLVAVPLVVVKKRRRLALTCADPLLLNSEGLQFAIRHVMYLTAFVACVLTAGKVVNQVYDVRDLIGAVIFIIPVFAVCFMAVALAALWATLGSSRWFFRAPIVLVLAGVTGAIPPYFFERGDSPHTYIMFPCIFLANAAIVIASLCVVRSTGVRLVRIESENMAEADTDSGETTLKGSDGSAISKPNANGVTQPVHGTGGPASPAADLGQDV